MLRVFFHDAPYIGALVRNALDTDKDRCVLSKTPAGVEILHGERRYLVPWSNVKSVELA